MSEKRVIDWERIESDYRAGVLSLREMATANKVSVAYIRKRADADGWERDLSAKIQAKADALVHKAECTASAQCTERVTVESNAQAIANIRLGHRGDIARVRALGLSLLSELEAQTADVDALMELGELLRAPDEKGKDKLNDLYRGIISNPSRIESAKKLSETLKNAITLEREAWGLASAPAPETPGEVDPVEGARRLAFVLARGAQALPTVH